MKTFEEKTTIIKLSELRDSEKLKKALKDARYHKVILEKRNKMEAVLMGLKRYKKMQRILDKLEDFALGYIAKKRERSSKPSDYIDIDEW